MNWNIYNPSMESIYENKKLFEQFIYYYDYLFIKDKLKDNIFIKNNFTYNRLDLFKKYIINEQNIGLFTIFNNIPDICHPLEKSSYINYSPIISFVDPNYFNLDNKNAIIILKNNIFEKSKYYKPLTYQDPAKYSKNKKTIFVDIKYFNKNKKYDLIICIDKTKNVYQITNEIKIKTNKYWRVVNNMPTNLIYVSILRKITMKDIKAVFPKMIDIKKDTKMYSYHNELKKKSSIKWFSFNKNEHLNDPFKVFYNPGDTNYQYTAKLKTDMKFIDLTSDILSITNLHKKPKKHISDLLYQNTLKPGYIYDGNLNYIKDYKSNDTWMRNHGKRLLNEIIFKSSNFIIIPIYYFFDFLCYYGINYFVYSYGYFEGLNKFYSYECGFKDNSYVDIIKIRKCIIQ